LRDKEAEGIIEVETHALETMKRLEGHHAIPKLYGYGRDEHFEFLAIDLLGKSLADEDDEFVREFSIQEVANIGVQTVRWSVNDICR